MNFTHLKYLIGYKPYQINDGWCFVWALHAREQVPFAQLFTYPHEGGHAFIRVNNKYYDAQSPLGVNHWMKLKFFQSRENCSQKSIEKQNIYDFCKYWAMQGWAPLPDKYKKYWDD